jgi:hypothetical protein
VTIDIHYKQHYNILNINNIKIMVVNLFMTAIHVLNYAIPIGFMFFFGYLIDRMCNPAKSEEKVSEE